MAVLALVATATGGYDNDDSKWTAAERPVVDPLPDLPRLILSVPAWTFELAMTPLSLMAIALEKGRVHERLVDLLLTDDRTFGVIPIIDPFDGGGVAVGATVLYNNPLGSPDRAIVLGLGRTNSDRRVSLSASTRVASLSGRTLFGKMSYDVDVDSDYYGIGGDTRKEDRQFLRIDAIDAEGGMTLLGPSVQDWEIAAQFAVRSRALATGQGTLPGVMGTDPTAPPGFGRTIDYLEGLAKFDYDTRDGNGWTSKGFSASIEAAYTRDLNDAKLGGFRTSGEWAMYFPVLPLNRVLVLAGGASMTLDYGAEEIPMHHMLRLGGSSRLRGYRTDRFIGELGWWSTLEYRYKVFEMENTGNGFLATLFADAGRVGSTPEELVKGPFAWSVGFVLRAETNLFSLFRVQVAYSPEGVRITVGAGEF